MMIFFVVLVILVVAAAGLYNGLIRKRNMVKEAWSGIDVQLKRRYDLIPNLVQSVKGYSKHEKELFEKVTQARAQAIEAKDVKAQGEAENALTGAIKSLFAVAENYPNLRANENFIDLQKNLSAIEDEIQMARRYYNGVVREYNTSIQSVPAVFFAKMLGFQESEFFEIEFATERKTPEVKF